MSTTKVVFSIAAVALLMILPAIFFAHSDSRPKAASIIPAKSTAQAQFKPQAGAPPKESKHYRPAPVSDSVRSKADDIIRRHAGMTREELMQSKELVALMERTMAVMNDPGVLKRIQDSIAQVQAVTGVQGDGSMTLELFSTIDNPRGRAWLEAAVSEDPKRMEEWLINRFNGSIFEFAVDPTLEKSSEGLSIVPAKPDAPPADGRKND